MNTRSLRNAACSMRRLATATAILLSAALLAGCGLGLPSELATPPNVRATEGEIEEIRLSWDAVPGASRYYVYRSRSDDPPPIEVAEEGDYGRVPFAGTNLTEFVDVTNGQATFSYQVSAVQEHTNTESEPSEVVTGFSTDGPVEWQAATTLGGFFTTYSTFRLTVDRAAVPPQAYVVSATSATDGAVAVRRVEPDGSLALLGEAFGEVNGSNPRIADLAVYDGTIRAALVDRTDDTVSIWRYDAATELFSQETTLDQPSFTFDGARSPLVSLVARNADEWWLAYLATGGELSTYRIDADGNATPVAAPGGTTDDSSRFVSQLELASSDETTAIAFELEDRSSDRTAEGATVEVVGATVSNSTWSSQVIMNGSTSHTPSEFEGSKVTAIALAVDPVTHDSHVLLGGDDADGATNFYLGTPSTAGTTPLTNSTLNATPLLPPPSIGLAASNNTLRFLYLDAGLGTAVIRSSDDGDSKWTEAGPEEENLTANTDIFALDLETPDERIFASWISGADGSDGPATVRAYQ